MSNIVGQVAIEYFTVNNQAYAPVPDIPPSEFEVEIYDSQNSLSSVDFSISHIGSGNYTISFTPNVLGKWYLILRHPVYFPWGKQTEIEVTSYSVDAIGEIVKRILGLSSENYYVDETQYDTNGNLTSSRVRIYSDSISVGTGLNVISEYKMLAVYDEQGLMLTYSMEKV